ncbi:hypothetical protein FNH22_03470 [Fulvivirga sp. M361]|uniref:hypothetical protein n=1 Tax=Fulvivirga sp. M361 TaxID=2594266 RepID=UPI00117AB8BD|nr:hypothetical protein [Fulvivirga sp. M361]TRX61847.1 hypothetical protein FNH22_03470 [Fulvivirga sp. M361]
MQVNTITRVDKSNISHLSFRKEEVLYNTSDQAIRQYNLNRGLKLGNLYKRSVLIRFETVNYEPMETEATIWAVTEKYIMLKGGAVIPIKAIINVIL